MVLDDDDLDCLTVLCNHAEQKRFRVDSGRTFLSVKPCCEGHSLDERPLVIVQQHLDFVLVAQEIEVLESVFVVDLQTLLVDFDDQVHGIRQPFRVQGLFVIPIGYYSIDLLQ